MQERIENMLDEVRPALARHGGGVDFVSFDDDSGIVSVRLQGACKDCPLSQVTLKMGIEAMLSQAIPEITEVVAVS